MYVPQTLRPSKDVLCYYITLSFTAILPLHVPADALLLCMFHIPRADQDVVLYISMFLTVNVCQCAYVCAAASVESVEVQLLPKLPQLLFFLVASSSSSPFIALLMTPNGVDAGSEKSGCCP